MKTFFQTSYSETMSVFHEASRYAGFSVEQYPLPNIPEPGPEPLYISVAAKGSENAENLLITTSGVHGMELPAGAALQSLWMRAYRATTQDIRMIHVCALNPYGAAHTLRTNECGIDINRNFIKDFQLAPETSEGFRSLRHDLVPEGFGWRNAVAWGRMLSYRLLQGEKRFKDVLMAGQYKYPDNLFYGGLHPSSSRVVWKNIVHEHCQSANSILHLDLHTGVGKYGQTQVVPQTELAGSITSFWAYLPGFKDINVTALTIEFGTLPGLPMFGALRARHILKTRYDDVHPAKEAIIGRCIAAFCPDDPKWRYEVATNGSRLFDKAKNWLKGAGANPGL